jgi:hypothetical protein
LKVAADHHIGIEGESGIVEMGFFIEVARKDAEGKRGVKAEKNLFPIERNVELLLGNKVRKNGNGVMVKGMANCSGNDEHLIAELSYEIADDIVFCSKR